MIVEEHYDEEALIALAEDCAEQDTHPHLVECSECREAVGEYRSMLASFSDESMWDVHPIDETPNPQTIATLRAYVDQMQREDAEAEPLVAELLAGPREEWMPRLKANAKYRTAGVVRKLIAATDRAAEESPKDYVEIAKLAVEIADNLSSPVYDVHEVFELRGASYRERSYSTYLTGDVASALLWQHKAHQSFALIPDAEYSLARIDLLAATLYWRSGRVADALKACVSAQHRFHSCGDARRVAHVLIVKANVLAECKDFRRALEVTSCVLGDYDSFLDDHSRAIVRLNEGFYLRELNEPEKAIARLQEAAFIFDATGARASSARVRMNMAALLLANGDLGAAAVRFASLMTELEELGMYSSAALAALSLAETHAANGHFDDVEELCGYAIKQAKTSPDAHRERALTALALLREASSRHRASPRLVKRVRRFLEGLPDQPHVVERPPSELS